jgi:hypothetical protein
MVYKSKPQAGSSESPICNPQRNTLPGPGQESNNSERPSVFVSPLLKRSCTREASDTFSSPRES